MNFFDFLAWPLVVFSRPFVIIIALVFALFVVWGWLFSRLRDWIESPWYHNPRRWSLFRDRIALPVALIVCIGLTYLIITTAVFVVALSPDGATWGG